MKLKHRIVEVRPCKALRQNIVLYIPMVKTGSKNSFRYKCAKIWNYLPKNITVVSTAGIKDSRKLIMT